MALKIIFTYRVKNHVKYKRDDHLLIIVDKLDAKMQQFYIANSPSYLADIGHDCGFEIVTPKQADDSGWTRISSETLIKLNPNNILYLAKTPEDAAEVKQSFKQNYPMLDAVKYDRLYVYDDPQITIPGLSVFNNETKLCEFLK